MPERPELVTPTTPFNQDAVTALLKSKRAAAQNDTKPLTPAQLKLKLQEQISEALKNYNAENNPQKKDAILKDIETLNNQLANLGAGGNELS